jgi:hypothetical protein
MKVEDEAASLKEKLDQLMKSKEALTMKTLKIKLLITEKKKEDSILRGEDTGSASSDEFSAGGK